MKITSRENKKQYYDLDEIGFVGTQTKRSSALVNQDIERTIQYVKGKRSPGTKKKITSRKAK
jgi:hypothetical protein